MVELRARELDRLKKSWALINDQLGRLYDEATCLGLSGKVMAFRLMHLHGRVLSMLVPRAVERFDDYEWVDSEVVAGMVLGWKFSDAHLHREELCAPFRSNASSKRASCAPPMIESQPLGRPTLYYRIFDVKTGLLEQGDVDIRELRARQPCASAA